MNQNSDSCRIANYKDVTIVWQLQRKRRRGSTGLTISTNSSKTHNIGVKTDMDLETVLHQIILKMQNQKIRYALIGSFALGLWGVVRSTLDLDFCDFKM